MKSGLTAPFSRDFTCRLTSATSRPRGAARFGAPHTLAPVDDRALELAPVDVVVARAADFEITLCLRDTSVTIGDIAAALGCRRGSLRVDGAAVSAERPAVASGLRRGSVLTASTGKPVSTRAVASLRRIAGPDAGPSVPLEAGVHVLGVPSERCLLALGPDGNAIVTDVATSTRRTVAHGEPFRVGDHVMVVDVPVPPAVNASGVAPSTGWTEPVRRPPRPLSPSPPAPVPVPSAANATDMGVGIGITASLAALAGSIAAAVLFHQPALLILGGFGAASGLGSGLRHHRRRRRQVRRVRRRAAADVAAFATALASHVADSEHARWTGAVDVATAVQRAATHHPRLWERRSTDPDFGLVMLGVGDVPWTPTLDASTEPLPDELARLVRQHDHLRAVPITVTVAPGTTVGLTGDLDAARALARSVVIQLAVTSGPADLTLSMAGPSELWRWTDWLPHSVSTTGGPERLRVLVVDGADAVPATTTEPVGTLVVAEREGDLPAKCTHVVHVERDVRLRLVHTRDGQTVDGVTGAGASAATAAHVARVLARFHDPELRGDGVRTPASVALGALLGPTAFDPKRLAARWRDAGVDAPLRAPIGVSPEGVFELDLVRDGPHALIAGTTGSGKSALLQTIVAGLAANASPDQLTFVLVDYKGGSAFDACARLPHVVGLVTDLDGHLVERALRSLEAELRRRERVMRRRGAADLPAYRHAAADGEPVPRLVIVVDEFAALADAWPELLRGLVGVAQRGRSLGVHLVLATQRPSGVVNDDIRANTNIRIALRVQDAADSVEVIGAAAAASIPHDRAGRAVVRLGSDQLVTVQVALAAAPISDDDGAAVEVSPRGRTAVAGDAGVGALDRLVAAACDAARDVGPPRRPWLDPLPAVVALRDVLPAVALIDDPDRQDQRPLDWHRDAGHLLLYGQLGSGTTTALAALALALGAGHSPDDLHLYVADLTAGALGALASLPQCGAVVASGETERLTRLVRRLRQDLDRRRADGRAGAPDVVVLVDGIEALRDCFDDASGQTILEDFDRVVAQGPDVGMVIAAAAERVGAVPATLAAVAGDRWVFRLSDPLDARTLGASVTPGRSWAAGRAVSVASGLELQIGWPGSDLTAAVAEVTARWPQSSRPAPIAVLPRHVPVDSLSPASTTPRPWVVPVGLADRDLEEAALVLHDGDHVLVAGPSRSGRSSILAVLARQLHGAAHIAAVAPRPSPLRNAPHDQLITDTARLVLPDGPVVVLVDDADWVADHDGVLARLLASGRSDMHVVAAVRADALRASYGQWAHAVRRSRLGVLLRPDPAIDGDLLGAVLPRRAAPRVTGRGYLVVDGEAAVVQFAV
jgi:S-DNA-T family DNA segregation ATPase FtsK/SpoIIIE